MTTTRTFRTRLRHGMCALTALLTAVTVGALTPSRSDASAVATFTNPAAIHAPVTYAEGTSATPITVSASGTPVGSVYPSTIGLTGAVGGLTALHVMLQVSHTAPDDLDVLLVAPSGKTVVLMSDAGGYADYDGAVGFTTSGGAVSLPDTTTFPSQWSAATNYVGNDAAGDVWPAPAPSVADPNAALTSLLGDSPNGTWKLFVHDDQDQDGGTITWSVSAYTDSSDTVPTRAATYPAGIAVSGLTGTVSDVDVTLSGVSMRDIDNLDAMLVAPDGRTAMLVSDVGGQNEINDVTLTLDDEAWTSLDGDSPPTSGRYRPTNFGAGDTFPTPAPDASTTAPALSAFDGADPNGTWKLFVVQDEFDWSPGVISGGWSLRITTSGSSAPRITSTKPAAHATGVRRGATMRATASKALKPTSVTGKTVYLTRAGSSRHIAATVSYLAGSHTIVIDPSRKLKADTRYRVVVTTDVRDAVGTRLDQDPTTTGAQQKTWKFKTR